MSYNKDQLVVYRLGENFDYNFDVTNVLARYEKTVGDADYLTDVKKTFSFICSPSGFYSQGKLYSIPCVYNLERNNIVTVKFSPEHFYYNTLEKVLTKERMFKYTLYFKYVRYNTLTAKYEAEQFISHQGMLNIIDSIPVMV